MKITIRLSEMDFESITALLKRDGFTMHYDASDCERWIHSQGQLDEVISQLIETWGDMEIEIDTDANWPIRILDRKWNEVHDAYIDDKAAFCAKYGCD